VAQFDVRLEMQIQAQGFRLKESESRSFPVTELDPGQSWQNALSAFIRRVLGEETYRADLVEVETLRGSKPAVLIHVKVQLAGKAPVLDKEYSWFPLADSAGSSSCGAGLDPEYEVELFTDGASRGNPGPAGIGVLMQQPVTGYEEELSRYIGTTTNNVAEYTALVEGLHLALERGVRRVAHYSDSELLVRQLEGSYRIKAPALRELIEAAEKVISTLSSFRIQHIPREQNSRADKLASQVLDKLG